MAQNSFYKELKRRNIFKVASIYAVTAWLIIQIVATTFPIFEFPSWSQKLIVVLILIGFPIALILAWAQESKINEISEEENATEPSSKRAAWVVPTFVGLMGIAALTLWFVTAPDKVEEQLLSVEIREERVGVAIFENFIVQMRGKGPSRIS